MRFVLVAAILLICGGCPGGRDDGDDGSPDAVPPDFADLDAKLAILGRGGEVDLDGDGRNETRATVDGDGTFRLTLDRDLDGTPEYVGLERADGSGSASSDQNEDGVHEWEETMVEGPPLVRTTLEDRDGDGRLETRTVQTIDASAGTQRILVEQDPSGTGTFQLVSDDLVSENEFQSDCADPFSGFPTNTGGPAITIGGISIPYDGGGGRCSKADAERIGTAVRCSLTLGELCLFRMDPSLAGKIIQTVAKRKVTVGCSLGSAGDCLTAKGVTKQGGNKVNLNPGNILLSSDSELCATMLHEMTHLAGKTHGADKTGGMGTDKIYACARWCGRKSCDPLDFADCGRCAGTNFVVLQDECSACGIAKAAGLACTYEGTTKLAGGAGATAGIVYDGNIRLVAMATVTEFQRPGVNVAQGIKYEASGSLAARLDSTICSIAPATTTFSASSFVGEFVIGVDPRIVGASCITNVPGTSLLCEGAPGPAPLTPAWSWLGIPGVAYTCAAPLSGMANMGDAMSTWNLSPR